MKHSKFIAIMLSFSVLFVSCNMNNTTKGGLIGGGGGAVLGGVIGELIGKNVGGAAIGAAIGAGLGTGAGILIGKKMDKVRKAAEEVANAQVEQVTDANGLQAVKVTFDSGILYTTGSATLSSTAKSSLNDFAKNVLMPNSTLEVAIQGYTDNAGFKNCTATQSAEKNLELSRKRANSVRTYLCGCGVANSQIARCEGYGEENPVATNDTPENMQKNRRVEIYMYASEEMIQAANNGTLQ